MNTLDDLSNRFTILEAECRQLRIENTELKERLNNNSSNSSLRPSSDFKKKKKNNRQSSGKKSGGQPGHKGHHRELLSTDRIDFFQNCELPENCLCGGKIKSSGDYMRHQVHELPILKLNATEYPIAKRLLRKLQEQSYCIITRRCYLGNYWTSINSFHVRSHYKIWIITS